MFLCLWCCVVVFWWWCFCWWCFVCVCTFSKEVKLVPALDEFLLEYLFIDRNILSLRSSFTWIAVHYKIIRHVIIGKYLTAAALGLPWQTQCNEAMPWKGKHDLISHVYSNLQSRLSHLGPRTSDLAPRTSDLEPRASNLGPRTSDLGPRTSNLEPRTSNLEPRTSSLEPQTSDLEPRTHFDAAGFANVLAELRGLAK